MAGLILNPARKQSESFPVDVTSRVLFNQAKKMQSYGAESFLIMDIGGGSVEFIIANSLVLVNLNEVCFSLTNLEISTSFILL